jgi:hypothetical protein
MGVLLQITCDKSADLLVLGQRYTFGVVKVAQARGACRSWPNAAAGPCACIWVRTYRED